MKISGRKLGNVHRALSCLIDEVRNRIATCPDPEYHYKELLELVAYREELERQCEKVAMAILREQSRDIPS